MNTRQEPHITISFNVVAWEHFPEHTNDAIEQRLDEHPPTASVWGSITSEDGTAGYLNDLNEADVPPVVQFLYGILMADAFKDGCPANASVDQIVASEAGKRT